MQTHYADLFRWLRYLTESEEAARDLTQQTFLAAWQGLSGFRFGASLRTWLHRIAYNEYARWRKSGRSHLTLEAAGELTGVSGLPQPEIFALERALKELPDEQREVFLLHHLQELSVAEIAEIQGVAGGTVKSRLFAARQRLRGLMSDEPTEKNGNGAERPALAGVEGGKR